VKPTICRTVVYRSRTGNYSVPAIITATVATLAPVGLERYAATGGQEGVPPLTSETHVHLCVMTPGIPGLRVEAQDFEVEGVRRAENVGGVYQEWDVPFDADFTSLHLNDEQKPGTWRAPVMV
jgi:hypothetical protein